MESSLLSDHAFFRFRLLFVLNISHIFIFLSSTGRDCCIVIFLASVDYFHSFLSSLHFVTFFLCIKVAHKLRKSSKMGVGCGKRCRVSLKGNDWSKTAATRRKKLNLKMNSSGKVSKMYLNSRKNLLLEVQDSFFSIFFLSFFFFL